MIYCAPGRVEAGVEPDDSSHILDLVLSVDRHQVLEQTLGGLHYHQVVHLAKPVHGVSLLLRVGTLTLWQGLDEKK